MSQVTPNTDETKLVVILKLLSVTALSDETIKYLTETEQVYNIRRLRETNFDIS
jgi:hypothetical protein